MDIEDQKKLAQLKRDLSLLIQEAPAWKSLAPHRYQDKMTRIGFYEKAIAAIYEKYKNQEQEKSNS